jgi:integrase
MKEAGWMLRGLARYAAEHGHRGPLTTPLALAWAQAPRQANPLWWATRLEVVRRFATFWRAFDPRTQLPPQGVFGPACRRRSPHIYTAQELQLLLQAAGQLGDRRGATFTTLLGLLACTGLRIGEALRLRDPDIDWTRALLTVHRSKFGRSRCLPLQDSALAALKRYRQERAQPPPETDRPTFFRGKHGQAVSYLCAASTFAGLRRQLGWTAQPVPRLHDLRQNAECGKMPSRISKTVRSLRISCVSGFSTRHFQRLSKKASSLSPGL